MDEKIKKLKTILYENEELSSYLSTVEENMTEEKLLTFINQILNDFLEYNNAPNRPAWYSDIQLITNKHGRNNPYPSII